MDREEFEATLSWVMSVSRNSVSDVVGELKFIDSGVAVTHNAQLGDSGASGPEIDMPNGTVEGGATVDKLSVLYVTPEYVSNESSEIFSM